MPGTNERKAFTVLDDGWLYFGSSGTGRAGKDTVLSLGGWWKGMDGWERASCNRFCMSCSTLIVGLGTRLGCDGGWMSPEIEVLRCINRVLS